MIFTLNAMRLAPSSDAATSIRYRLYRIGGSHAQRTNWSWYWQRYADALGAAEDFEAAGQARERAAAIEPV